MRGEFTLFHCHYPTDRVIIFMCKSSSETELSPPFCMETVVLERDKAFFIYFEEYYGIVQVSVSELVFHSFSLESSK